MRKLRFLHCSDWHADHVTRGVARFDEIARAVGESVQVAKRYGCDYYVFTGDLCDPDVNLTVAASIGLSLRTALQLTKQGIPSLWIPGNHCVIEDGSGSTVLTPLAAYAKESDHVRVYEQPTIESLGDSVFRLLALPFTPTSHTYDPAEWAAKTLVDTMPLLVLSHLSVEGVQPGEETKEMARGRDVLLPLGILKQRKAPTLVCQGHYHRRQIFEDMVHIAGSLVRLTFGEEGNEPGYSVIEWSF